MSANDIDKSFVSPFDKFLFEFDANHGKTESQLQEIQKHQRIATMRDDANYAVSNDAIWEGF